MFVYLKAAQWSAALAQGVTAVRTYGGADVGMRTLLDALVPAVAALAAPATDTKQVGPGGGSRFSLADFCFVVQPCS